jgi:hypothetical protein
MSVRWFSRALWMALMPAFAPGTAAAAAVWSFDGEGERATLVLAEPGSDEVEIAFSCKPGSGRVRIFVSESKEGLKVGRTLPAALLVRKGASAPVRATAQARVLSNELAGIPSLELDLKADEAALLALPAGDQLAVEVAGATLRFSLKGAGDKARRFNRTCEARR